MFLTDKVLFIHLVKILLLLTQLAMGSDAATCYNVAGMCMAWYYLALVPIISISVPHLLICM